MEFYIKENGCALAQIKELLLNGEEVKVHNIYETFYGISFDRWLRK